MEIKIKGVKIKNVQEYNKEYNKEYYEKNKDKMKEQIINSTHKRRVKYLIERLNNGGYKRFPYQKIEKYHIKYDGNRYYIDKTEDDFIQVKKIEI
jgi:hypothetical protein